MLTRRKVRSIPQRGISHTSYLCSATLPGYFEEKPQQDYRTATAYVALRTLVVRPIIVLWTSVVASKMYLTLVVSYGAYCTYFTLVVSCGACSTYLALVVSYGAYENVLDVVSRLLRGF